MRRAAHQAGTACIGGKTLRRIDFFLCDRQQRVMVNGVKSDWAPVLSGVPQGPVLGPLFFLLYINDITEDIDLKLRPFADDCVCYREIKDIEDTVKLQEDRPFRVLGKELGHEIPTSQMQYNADYKKTNQKDQCFL